MLVNGIDEPGVLLRDGMRLICKSVYLVDELITHVHEFARKDSSHGSWLTQGEVRFWSLDWIDFPIAGISSAVRHSYTF